MISFQVSLRHAGVEWLILALCVEVVAKQLWLAIMAMSHDGDARMRSACKSCTRAVAASTFTVLLFYQSAALTRLRVRTWVLPYVCTYLC